MMSRAAYIKRLVNKIQKDKERRDRLALKFPDLIKEIGDPSTFSRMYHIGMKSRWLTIIKYDGKCWTGIVPYQRLKIYGSTLEEVIRKLLA
jgi:hypothetical protein